MSKQSYTPALALALFVSVSQTPKSLFLYCINVLLHVEVTMKLNHFPAAIGAKRKNEKKMTEMLEEEEATESGVTFSVVSSPGDITK